MVLVAVPSGEITDFVPSGWEMTVVPFEGMGEGEDGEGGGEGEYPLGDAVGDNGDSCSGDCCGEFGSGDATTTVSGGCDGE